MRKVRRTAIVTGGARGLGRVMALALLEAGYNVTVTGARAIGELGALREEAAAIAGDGRLLALQADVRNPDDCERVVASTLEAFGGLHALVNNAGRGMREISEEFTTVPVRFWEIEPYDWRTILDINVDGAFLMARAAMPHFLEQGHGRIVNVSTSAVTMTRRGYSPYGPSKAALEAATQSWARDAEGTGVTVNLLLPGGAADTELLPAGPERRGSDGNLLDPGVMGAPAVWLCSAESEGTSGERFIARYWDAGLPDVEARDASRSAHVVGV
jgi:3-oxoacyl-[acyl-carrier protein] reductase